MRRIPVYKLLVVFFIFLFLPNQFIFSSTTASKAKIILSVAEQSIKANEKVEVFAKVTDPTGKPLSNQPIMLSFTGLEGRFLPDTEVIRSNQEGQAEIIWQAGINRGKVTFTASIPSAVSSCQLMVDPAPKADPTGRIIIPMSKECAEGTTILVYDQLNRLVASLTPDETGTKFDSGCTLNCNETYIIKPIKNNCTFSPVQMHVTAKCCPEVGYFTGFTCSCNKETIGKVSVKLPPNCVKDTIIKVLDSTGKLVATIPAPNPDGIYENPCDLICGDTYTVQPYNPTCQFTPPSKSVVAKCCPVGGDIVSFESCTCGEKKDGKLIIKLPPDSTKNAVVRISLPGGANPMYLYPNKDGYFDTGCELVCGEMYRIEPYNPDCKFTPAAQYVKAACCSDTEIPPVAFSASCTAAKTGKIGVKIPLTCLDGAKVYVTDSSGAYVTQLTSANSEGLFESTCTLVCGATYKVTPVSSKSCTFSPTSLTVKANCCPDPFEVATFTDCTCPPQVTGKIKVSLPKDALSGTKVLIYDKDGTLVTYLSTYTSDGIFESTCNLTCDATYTVKPYSATCTFTPETMTVVAKCCPSYGFVAFTQAYCQKQKGSIVAKLPTDCAAKTTLRITSVDTVGTPIYLTVNSKGLFDTGCVLNCGDSYRVEAIGSGCTYNPPYQIVKAICCTSTPPTPITFTCSCAPAKNGKIVVQVPVDALKDTKIYVTTLSGEYVTQLTTPSTTGRFESECILACDATYKVTIANPNCTFSPPYQTVIAKCCPAYGFVSFTKYTCPPVKNGKIKVKIPLNCIKDTKIYIQQVGGTFSTYLTTADAEGVFESDCTLLCGTTYKVTPYNPTCTFTPGYLSVVAKCCPDYGMVVFDKCSCPPPKTGKIAVKVPVSCLPGTKIYVTELSGANPIQLTKASEEGVFESPCTLTCGVTYKVTPANPTCKFEPSYLSVVAKCCPEFDTVVFEKCTCPPAKTGKIKVQVPINAVSGTRIYLIDSKGGGVVLTTGNGSTGIFESTCTLICDETYTVQPMNSYYTFSPATQKVVAKCCPGYGGATFNATKKTTLLTRWIRRYDTEAI